MKQWNPRLPVKETRYFSSDGYDIAYRYFGEKKEGRATLLFLYGFGGNSEMVSVLADGYLSKNYQILTVDYPGHSFSPNNKKFELDKFVSAINNLLLHLDEKSIYLVGYSLGGLVSLKLFYSKVVNIKKLMLLHSAASFSYTFFKRVFYTFLSFMLRVNFNFTVLTVAMKVLRDKYFTKELLQTAREVELHNDPQSVTDYFNDLIFRDLSYILKEIDIPTLIIGSKLDTLATPKAVSKTKSSIANSELVILNDIGHLSVVTRPDVIDDLITNFLSK